jgi:hypothetical protein
MARFPRNEPEIDELAESMIRGFESHADEFPTPPVKLEQLRASLEAFRSTAFASQTAWAEARLATQKKGETLKKLVGEMKTNLRYAENTCGYDNATLKPLGWGGRGAKKAMEVPGQTAGLAIIKEGPGWIELSWDKPIGGGEVRAYRIERCSRGGERWEIAGMSTATRAKLEKQERGVQWMYRVVAVNAVGEGMESATAEAVL